MEAGPRLKRGPALRGRTSGAHGEDLAVAYLLRLGYVVLDRNATTRIGEIDIVARDGDYVVFVEVKRRIDASHGTAAEFVNPGKRRRVVAAAKLYASRYGLTDAWIRFDVMTIDGPGDHTEIRHHKGAFDAR